MLARRSWFALSVVGAGLALATGCRAYVADSGVVPDGHEDARATPAPGAQDAPPTEEGSRGAKPPSESEKAANGPIEPHDLLIDATNDRLLVLGTDRDHRWPLVQRCTRDVSQCTTRAIDTGRGPHSIYGVSATLDVARSKLLVVVIEDGTNKVPTVGEANYQLSLYRCELDGTSCVHRDVSAGQSRFLPVCRPAPAITDDAFVVGACVVSPPSPSPSVLSSEAGLIACAVDGTNCTAKPLVPAIAIDKRWDAGLTVIVEPGTQNVLAVVDEWQTRGTSLYPVTRALFGCDATGSACVPHELGGAPRFHSHAALEQGELLVVANGEVTDNGAWIVGDAVFSRCAVDGTNCVHSTLPSSNGIPTDRSVVTPEGFFVSGHGPSGTSVLQCGSDGSTCTSSTLAPNGTLATSSRPIVFDALAQRVLVADEVAGAPVIFRLSLDGSSTETCELTSNPTSTCK